MGRLQKSSTAPWSSSGEDCVLVISPHPDDETIACSGTMARHLAAGDDITVVIATDGRRSRSAPTQDEVVAIRRDEARLAARRLGIDRLEWLGQPEGAWIEAEMSQLLLDLLIELSPTIVYAPSRVDFHPEHLAVSRALAAALERVISSTEARPLVRIYQVQVPLTRTLTNVVVDISEELEKSDLALRAYRSQAATIEFLDRRRDYSARAHRYSGPVEEFWELSAAQYAVLHNEPLHLWAGGFRGLRRFAWTDPLAYLLGNRERHRLRALVGPALAPR